MAMGKFIKADRIGRVAADRDTPPLARSRQRWQHSTVMNPCLPSNYPVITRLETAAFGVEVTVELLALRMSLLWHAATRAGLGDNNRLLHA